MAHSYTKYVDFFCCYLLIFMGLLLLFKFLPIYGINIQDILNSEIWSHKIKEAGEIYEKGLNVLLMTISPILLAITSLFMGIFLFFIYRRKYRC